MASEKDTLLQAKALIQARNFTEARKVLEPVRHHPIAQKWLNKLDEIAPVLPDNPPSIITPPQTIHPWNPNNFSVMLFMFLPMGAAALSMNWGRFGKPLWGTFSCLMGILLMVGGIGFITLSAMFDGMLAAIPLGFGFSMLMGNLIFWYMISHIQGQAFKKWEQGDMRGAIEHDYRLGRNFLIWTAISLTLGIGATLFFLFSSRPITYADEVVSITYAKSWDALPPEEQVFCQESYLGCFLYLQQSDYTPMTLAFSYEAVTTGQSSDTFAVQAWRNYLRSAEADVAVQAERRVKIGDYEGYWWEYVYAEVGWTERLYAVRIAIILPNQVLWVNGWTVDEEAFRGDEEAIIKILRDDMIIQG